jgi:F-type H+-transporting ATPase subunit b
MNDLLEKLGIEPLLLIAQAVNFLLLLVILSKFLYRPLISMLDKRSEKIEKSLRKAEQIEMDARKAQERFDQKISDAHKQASELIDQAKKDADQAKVNMIKQAEEKSNDIITRGKNILRQERELLSKELRQETAQLVVKATTQILEEELTEEKKKQIEQKVINSLS